MSYSSPPLTELPPVFLTTMHYPTWRGALFHSAVPASAAWSTTNRIIYVPFYLNVGQMVYRLFWLNGATVGTNNLQAGVYDKNFNRLINGTSTLSANANVCQFDDITDTYLDAGTYYMALWCNGTTATTFRLASIGGPMGIYYETNAGGLPATGTPADTAITTGGATIPVMGLAFRATDP